MAFREALRVREASDTLALTGEIDVLFKLSL